MTAVFGCLFAVAAVVAVSAVYGWALMLLLGVLWHEFGWLKPLGFLPCWGIGALLGFLTNMLRNDS